MGYFTVWINLDRYRTRAIITRGLYILNPLFEYQKRFVFQGGFFKKFCLYVWLCIQERFVTKSGLWWRVYGNYFFASIALV